MENPTDTHDTPLDSRSEFCTRLAIARKAAGLSQAAVGEAAGYRGTSRAKMGRLLEHVEPDAVARIRGVVDELRRQGVEVTFDWLFGDGPRLGSAAPARNEPAPLEVERRGRGRRRKTA